MAAVRHGLLDRGRLQRLTEASERVDRWNTHAMAEASRELHRAVWHASFNHSLIDVLERLHLHLRRYAETTLTAPGRWDQALAEHRTLVSAIMDGNPERAGEAAERHFRAARDVRLTMWEQGRT